MPAKSKNTVRRTVNAVRCPHCRKEWLPRKPGPWRCSGCWKIVER